MTPRALPLACVLLLAPACKKEGPTDLPICLSEVAGDEAVEASSGQLPPEIWFQVLLKSYNRKTGLAPSPVKDCSGKLVQPELPPETAACIAGTNAGAPLPERALVPDDLVIVPTDDGRSLVWVKARHFDDGDALGPIAIAEWTKRGIAVRSIGAMRAHANRAKLRLEPMGSGKVLVVESDECAKDNPKQCERIMRLVPMVGDRFDERAVVLADGTCVGPAEFSLYSKREVSQGSNLRSFELTRTVSFTDGNVMMGEAVVIKDRDPSKPDEPAKVFRNASVQRPLTLTEHTIQTTPGVWEPMLAEHGSVSAPRASE